MGGDRLREHPRSFFYFTKKVLDRETLPNVFYVVVMEETIIEYIMRKRLWWPFLIMIPMNAILLSTDPVEGKFEAIALVNIMMGLLISALVLGLGIIDQHYDINDEDDDDDGGEGKGDPPDEDYPGRRISPEIFS